MPPLSSDQPMPDDIRHDEHRSAGSSRRSFLKGLGVVAAGGVMATMPGTAFRKGAFAAGGPAGHVVVVVNLCGGSDGLSLVVPYGDPAYAAQRPSIAVPPSTLLQPDGMFGLHPSLGPLEAMWAEGLMAAVVAVGSWRPGGSDSWATDEAEIPDPASTVPTGWINRMAGMTDPANRYGAVQIDDSIRVYDPEGRGPLGVAWQQVDGPLGKALRSGMDAPAARAGRHGSPAHRSDSGYPPTHLGRVMAQAARVIRSDVGVALITVDHSPWHMIANLGTFDHGRMHRMISDLAGSIAAFFADLGALGSTVTLLTTSEFGRKVHENASGGLDNGYGNNMLVMGAGVEGGTVYGTWPGCGVSEQTENGSLKVTTDYRSVVWEVAQARFPLANASALFPGFEPVPVGVMHSA